MPHLVGHRVDGDQVVLLGEVVEFGSRIRMRDRDLDGLVVEPLGEVDRLAQAGRSLAKR